MIMSLLLLCLRGDLNGVESALANGEDVNTADIKGWTGLIWAAERGHLELVQFLLQQPSLDVNMEETEDGRTALHWACYRGHLSIVRALLNLGPRLTCLNLKGSWVAAPVMQAVVGGHAAVVKELVGMEGLDLDTKAAGMTLEEVAKKKGDCEEIVAIVARAKKAKIIAKNGRSLAERSAEIVASKVERVERLKELEVPVELLPLLKKKHEAYWL